LIEPPARHAIGRSEADGRMHALTQRQGSGTTSSFSQLAKGAHLRAVDRPGAVTDAAAAPLSVAPDTAMCLLAVRSAVTCKRTWLSLAWRSSHQRRHHASLPDGTRKRVEPAVYNAELCIRVRDGLAAMAPRHGASPSSPH
jgi:hypothetical protein